MSLSGIARVALLLLPILLLASCGGSRAPYIENVYEFNLNSTNHRYYPPGLTRSQTAYLLYGQMTTKERGNKRGQYYTIHWEDTTPDQPLDLIFDYQRAGHGSKYFSKTIAYPSGREGGEVNTPFEFIGDDYVASGRIMTWRVRLMQDGKEISRRTSYLWADPR